MHRPHRTQIATSEVQGRHCNALPEKHGSLISVNLHPRHSYGTQSRVESCHERFLPNHHIACELRAPSCASRRKSSYGCIVILGNNTYSRYCKNQPRRKKRTTNGAASRNARTRHLSLLLHLRFTSAISAFRNLAATLRAQSTLVSPRQSAPQARSSRRGRHTWI